MPIQFAQINDFFFKFVAVPIYYKEKSDKQPVLLKTMFSFGRIQISTRAAIIKTNDLILNLTPENMTQNSRTE